MAIPFRLCKYIFRLCSGLGEALGAHWNLDAVGAAFAATAVGATPWTASLAVLSDATGSVGTCLVPMNARITMPPPHSDRLAEVNETYLHDGWVERDVRYCAVPTLLRRGAASEFDFITINEIERHPYYQDWLARHGLRSFCGVKVAFGDDLWVLSIQRSIKQGPFTADEVKRLATLSRSLASAGALARALGFARAEAALAAFEVSGVAVALIDRFGSAFRLNPAAEKLLSPDLRIVQGRIVSSNHAATAAIERTLHLLLWRRIGQPLAPPAVLPRAEKRPLLAYAVRPPAICADALAACQAIVVLIDPESRARPPEADIRAAFGLAPAEARLAAQLAVGERLGDAAEALGITYETARTELKRVFSKTGVSRQSELVALLSRLVPRQ